MRNNLKKSKVLELNTKDFYKNWMPKLAKTQKWCSTFNKCEAYSKQWHSLLNKTFDAKKKNITIFKPLCIDYLDYLHIGKNVFVHSGLTANAVGDIFIGNDVMISFNVTITTSYHDTNKKLIVYAKPVVIKDDAAIYANATILPGVTIGKGSVVAAGSVVTKDVPDHVIVAGVPAKIIRRIK